MLLIRFVERYFLARALRRESERQYEQVARMTSKLLGREALVSDLTDDVVNSLLRRMSLDGYSPSYVRSRRNHLIALWRLAAEQGLAAPPQWVRPVRVPQRTPLAWSREQVERLLREAGRLDGRYRRLDCRRAAWWDLAIRLAWDAGLRRCDQLAAARSEVDDAGRVFVVQRKTGKALPPRLLAPETLRRLDAFLDPARELLCPWPFSENHFCGEFRTIVERSHLEGGWHKLRRSSGTAVEAEYPGFGAAHLGDSEQVFRRHYLDPRLAGRHVPGPRPLAG